MNRYKNIGIFILFIGTSQIVLSIVFLISLLPKLSYLSELDSNISLNSSYIYMTILLIIGVINIFLSIQLFSKSQGRKELYYKAALIFLLIDFVLGGKLISETVRSVITPIYTITSQIQ